MLSFKIFIKAQSLETLSSWGGGFSHYIVYDEQQKNNICGTYNWVPVGHAAVVNLSGLGFYAKKLEFRGEYCCRVFIINVYIFTLQPF